MDKDYDVKIYYGIFNHDAEEAQWRLKGGPIPTNKNISNATSPNYSLLKIRLTSNISKNEGYLFQAREILIGFAFINILALFLF